MKIKLLVEGGKANAGPPLGPTLAQAKVNIGKVVSAINEKTKEFVGMKVPVVVDVNERTKEFEISVGTPPVSALIKKELKVKKLSKAPWGVHKPKEGEVYTEFKGNITMDQIVKITKAKEDDLVANNFKNAVKQVVGTCVSCGVTVEEKNPKEITAEINEGKWDEKIK